jgi:hypothetical protein
MGKYGVTESSTSPSMLIYAKANKLKHEIKSNAKNATSNIYVVVQYAF